MKGGIVVSPDDGAATPARKPPAAQDPQRLTASGHPLRVIDGVQRIDKTVQTGTEADRRRA